MRFWFHMDEGREHWITVNGAHVLIGTDGQARTGPRHLAAIRHYTAGGYREINRALRTGAPLDAATQAHVEVLDELLKPARLDRDQTLYRGVGPSFFGDQASSLRRGDVIEESGYTSTSRHLDVARRFAPRADHMVIHVGARQGSRALDISPVSQAPFPEHETLIARKALYRVVRYDPKSKALHVELLPHENDR